MPSSISKISKSKPKTTPKKTVVGKKNPKTRRVSSNSKNHKKTRMSKNPKKGGKSRVHVNLLAKPQNLSDCRNDNDPILLEFLNDLPLDKLRLLPSGNCAHEDGLMKLRNWRDPYTNIDMERDEESDSYWTTDGSEDGEDSDEDELSESQLDLDLLGLLIPTNNRSYRTFIRRFRFPRASSVTRRATPTTAS